MEDVKNALQNIMTERRAPECTVKSYQVLRLVLIVQLPAPEEVVVALVGEDSDLHLPLFLPFLRHFAVPLAQQTASPPFNLRIFKEK